MPQARLRFPGRELAGGQRPGEWASKGASGRLSRSKQRWPLRRVVPRESLAGGAAQGRRACLARPPASRPGLAWPGPRLPAGSPSPPHLSPARPALPGQPLEVGEARSTHSTRGSFRLEKENDPHQKRIGDTGVKRKKNKLPSKYPFCSKKVSFSSMVFIFFLTKLLFLGTC